MDMVTLAMAKAYTDSKCGYEESYSITFDGNPDGKTMIHAGNAPFCKVSDKVLTKEELLGATYVDSFGTAIVAEQHIIDNSAVGVSTQLYGLNVRQADAPFVVSCKACSFNFGGVTVEVPEDGTYFICADAFYVSELSNKTIHPIDPKFIPWDSAPGGGSSGGGAPSGVTCFALPVLSMSMEDFGAIVGAGGAPVLLAEKHQAALDYAHGNMIPIIFANEVASYIVPLASEKYFSLDLGGGLLWFEHTTFDGTTGWYGGIVVPEE